MGFNLSPLAFRMGIQYSMLCIGIQSRTLCLLLEIWDATARTGKGRSFLSLLYSRTKSLSFIAPRTTEYMEMSSLTVEFEAAGLESLSSGGWSLSSGGWSISGRSTGRVFGIRRSTTFSHVKFSSFGGVVLTALLGGSFLRSVVSDFAFLFFSVRAFSCLRHLE